MENQIAPVIINPLNPSSKLFPIYISASGEEGKYIIIKLDTEIVWKALFPAGNLQVGQYFCKFDEGIIKSDGSPASSITIETDAVNSNVNIGYKEEAF